MPLRTKPKYLTCASSSSAAVRRFCHQLNHLSSSAVAALQQDPYSQLQELVQILSDLWLKALSQPQKPFHNLTGFLSKLDLWVLAYQRACAHATGSFPSKNALPSHTLYNLLSLKDVVVHNQFRWNSKLQQYVRSPNDKPVPILLSKSKIHSLLKSDTPPFQDLVVEEVLLMIIEPVFDSRFSPKSHAFRPGRNPHTVIRTMRSNFAGYLWFIIGDISAIFENAYEKVVLGCVEKAIKDKKVLHLIKSGLKGPREFRLSVADKGEKLSVRKRKKGQTKKRILGDNEPKPDPYWIRTFFVSLRKKL